MWVLALEQYSQAELSVHFNFLQEGVVMRFFNFACGPKLKKIKSQHSLLGGLDLISMGGSV